MKKSILALLAFLPLLADAASYRTMKPEILFEEQIALTKRDEASGATVTALDTSTSFIKITGTVTTVEGAVAPPSPASRMIIVANQSATAVTFSHEAAGATAANRFVLSEGQDLEVPAGGSAMFLYDHGQSRWVMAGGGAGGVSFTAVAPIVYDALTKELTCAVASTSQPGCISASDWTKFDDGADTADGAAQAIDDHINDTTGAHAASAIGVTPSGNLAADDVQEALVELQSDVDTRIADPASKQNGMSLQVESGAPIWKAQSPRNNWLVNESFEYATATSSWSESGVTFAADTSTKVQGAQSIKMPAGGAASIAQSVTPPVDFAGTSVEHSVWIKTTDASVGACALRAGASYECKSAVADGLWHKISFLYNDPGTGTRGITVYRSSTGATDTYADAAYVGPFSGPTPAQINVGGADLGAISFSSAASCTFDRTSNDSYDNFSAVSACASATRLRGSGVAAPTTKQPYITIFNASPNKVYTFKAFGQFRSMTQGYVCGFRFSDGTDSSQPGSLGGGAGSQSGISMPYIAGDVKFSTGGTKNVHIQATGEEGSAQCQIQLANQGLTISVEEKPDASQLAGAIITDEPWYYLSSKSPTRVTGAAPSAEGQYRSYLRNSGAHTFTETNGSPGTAPSTTNGFLLYGGNAFSSADTNNEPSYYEHFIGKDKTIEVEFYRNTGRDGAFTASPVSGSGADYGVETSYSPTSGILTITAYRRQTGGTSHDCGYTTSGSGNAVHDCYFDVKVFNNPLAAGLKTAKNEIRLSTPGGYGNIATRIRYYTVVADNIGDAVTCTSTANDGSYCTINKDGWYNVAYQDKNSGGSMSGGISRNASDLTASIHTLPISERICMAENPGDYIMGCSRSLPLKKGDVIRSQSISANASSNQATFSISKAPSPFEIAGAMPGGETYRKVGRWPTTTALSTSPTTLTFGTAAFATDGNMNAGTGVYTVTQAGYYTLSTYLTTNATSGTGVMVGYVLQTGSKNETIEISRLGKISSTSTAKFMSGQVTIYAQSGDTLRFQAQDADSNTLTSSYVEISYTP